MALFWSYYPIILYGMNRVLDECWGNGSLVVAIRWWKGKFWVDKGDNTFSFVPPISWRAAFKVSLNLSLNVTSSVRWHSKSKMCPTSVPSSFVRFSVGDWNKKSTLQKKSFERGPDEGIDKMIYSFESLNHFNVFDTSNAINRTSIKTRS